MERMSGADATMLYLEAPHAPMHTLKVVVADTSRRGRPLSLADVGEGLGRRLARYPRFRQRVVTVPLALSHPLWVDDPDFRLDAHLSERTLPAPGGRDQLDALCSELASHHLPRDRPLWDLTLVHGLEGDRQAVVVRIHHAVTDGLGAISALVELTDDDPGDPGSGSAALASPDRWRPEPIPGPARLVAGGIADLVRRLVRLPRLVREGAAGGRLAKREWSARPHLPAKGVRARRTSLNGTISSRRICRSLQLSLDDVRLVKDRFGCTVNHVLLALVAEAYVRELARRGEPVPHPLRATFGVAVDGPADRPPWGNRITPVYTSLCTEVADPVERLRAIARCASDIVSIRRQVGLARGLAWAEYASPLSFWFFHHVIVPYSPVILTNAVTANVPGPPATRWAGEVELVDFISYAILQPSAGINITVYSYAGHLTAGILSAPEVVADLRPFTADLTAALDHLVQAARVAPDTPSGSTI